MRESKKIKILTVITKSNWGGAQKYVYDLVTGLPREEFDIAVALGGVGALAKKLSNAGIRTIPVASLERDVRMKKELLALWEILQIVRNEKPDIVHVNSSKAGGLGALAARISGWTSYTARPTIIFTVHGWGFYEPRPAIERAAIALASAVTAWLSDTVICISERDADSAHRFVSRKKIRIIPNGIAPVSPLSRDEARRALSRLCGKPLSSSEMLIGSIAELTKNKGHSYLLEALRKTKEAGMRTKTILIGDGELRNELEETVNRLGLRTDVHFTGFVEDAENYLSAFDLFILPSLKEGVPYTILEAMAARVPVVATTTGGVPDVLESGKSGLLVPPSNARALAETIIVALTDTHMRLSLAESARAVIEQRYTIERMRASTEALYRELYAKRS